MTLLNKTMLDEKQKSDSLKITLDPVHNGLRLAVMGSFIGSGSLAFVAGLFLIPNGAVLAFVIAVAIAGGTSFGLERYLKDSWPSGREFVADQERIALTRHNKIEAVINVSDHVNVLTWRFEVKKDGPRAKKGWVLLGLGLEQADNFIVIYSAASPDEYETMPLASRFKRLEKPDTGRKGRAKTAASGGMRLAGEQKRLYEAEVMRQIIGGDMLYEDFERSLEYLQDNYPQWMPQA